MASALGSEKALVLFSGGQDSGTCLAWALDRFAVVETIGFDYRQNHHVELDVRLEFLDAIRSEFESWASRLGSDHFVDMALLGEISETALTRQQAINVSQSGLPSTFVPGRNLLFITVAAAVAYRRGLKHLIGGMCETDYSGYPDCRDDTIKALQAAISLGMDRRFAFHTPLMWLDKAATWEMAHELGGQKFVDLVLEHTHTCYRGDRSHRHPWGYGCGSCPACELRANGWSAYLSAMAPTA